MRVSGTRPPTSLPSNLQPLADLARDLRWSWRASLRALFAAVDPEAWERTGGNPPAVLAEVTAQRLDALSRDPAFLAQLAGILAELGTEDSQDPILPALRAMQERGDSIAYFSTEFGLTEHLPIYAGGLGVLAGDHLKSSSDLGLPMIGVGLFYRHGYFRQALDAEGTQQESYPPLNPERLPISVALAPDGSPATITLPIGERVVQVLVRLLRVGRVPVLLLDTDLAENAPEDRAITANLYGGDQETRIRQEIVLGIGGLRALQRLGLRPTIRHLNEGHAAFVGLEEIRQLVAEENLSFADARDRAAAGNVFTTHTPVPAGIDKFPSDLVRKYLAGYVPGAGLELEEFIKLGQENPANPAEPFSMPVLALRLSGHANAVSQLHARVSRRLWLGLLPELADEDVRIRAITNGVHRATWTDPEIAALALSSNPTENERTALWRVHERLRERLVRTCRERLLRRAEAASAEERERLSQALDPSALTIGFARRFASYKRATLIFHDPERLRRILDAVPVQLVFAGKAHPKDEPGKELLRAVSRFAGQPEFRGRVVLLPDYDMAVARAMVAGCDVWLNNPIRPHEASGTSGMKAAMNGVLNLSVLDGWWDEAPYEETGFVIGRATDDAPDADVASSLYEALEASVLPLFFTRDEEGIPRGWVERMVQSATRIGRLFSSDRMVSEYLEVCYVPAAERRIDLLEGTRARGVAVGPSARLRA
jgi:starch phosphorylase